MVPSEDEVREFLRRRGAGPHVIEGGAHYLLTQWRRFVDDVQKGYSLGLDDYCNDLDVRTLIELAGLGPLVIQEDLALRAHLIRTDVPIWESEVPHAFWVRGYPSNASGQLLADLRARTGI